MTGSAVYSSARCTPVFLADHETVAPLGVFTAGRGNAPSGVPTRLYRVGGEGTRLRGARGAWMVLRGCASQISRFFALLFCPHFFVASVVAPPECAMGCTTRFLAGKHGH